MQFNSWTYLIFLLVAVALYWAVPHRARIWTLCAFSLLFYSMWRWQFTLLLILSPTVDYLCSLRIAAASGAANRKFWLRMALAINLGLLVFFKYTYFLYDNVRSIVSLVGVN